LGWFFVNSSASANRNLLLLVAGVLLIGLLFFVAKGIIRDSAGNFGDGGEGHKILFLALDGLEWDVIDPLIEKGDLPNLKRLMDQGTYCNLTSVEPSRSPLIWTTIATGDTPEEHGVLDFIMDGRPVTSDLRRTKALWNILTDFERTVGMIGYYVTWPVEEVKGYMISDRLHNFLMSRANAEGLAATRMTYPADLLDSYVREARNWHDPDKLASELSRFMNYSFDPNYRETLDESSDDHFYHFLIDQRLFDPYCRDRIYMETACHLLAEQPIPDLFTLYLRGTDYVGHAFWRFYRPEQQYENFAPVTPQEKAMFGSIIPNYYKYADQCVGAIIDLIDQDETNILVISDHGFTKKTKGRPEFWYLTGGHRIQGTFIARGPDIRNLGATDDLSVYDVTPLIVHLLGLPQKKNAHGKVPLHIIDEDFAGTSERAPIQSIERDAREGQADSLYDEEIKEELRSLGYIR
jgi:hypothetical protein